MEVSKHCQVSSRRQHQPCPWKSIFSHYLFHAHKLPHWREAHSGYALSSVYQEERVTTIIPWVSNEWMNLRPWISAENSFALLHFQFCVFFKGFLQWLYTLQSYTVNLPQIASPVIFSAYLYFLGPSWKLGTAGHHVLCNNFSYIWRLLLNYPKLLFSG